MTKHGRPAAILLSVADHEGVLETLDILSEAAATLEGRRQALAGRSEAVTRAEALKRWMPGTA